DYGEGYRYSSGSTGAPVNAEGEPVYHYVPKNWDAAKSDGERWRWVLSEASVMGKRQATRASVLMAEFCQSQFGVQTLAYYRAWGRVQNDNDETRNSVFALDTLGEDETIARLATGPRCFKLPD